MRKNKAIMTLLLVVVGVWMLLYSSGYRLTKQHLVQEIETELPNDHLLLETQMPDGKELRIYEIYANDGIYYKPYVIDKTGFLWSIAMERSEMEMLSEQSSFVNISYVNKQNNLVYLIYVKPGITPYIEYLKDLQDLESVAETKVEPLVDNIYFFTAFPETLLFKKDDSVIEVANSIFTGSGYFDESTLEVNYNGKTLYYSEEDLKDMIFGQTPGIQIHNYEPKQEVEDVIISYQHNQKFYLAGSQNKNTTIINATYSKIGNHYLLKEVREDLPLEDQENEHDYVSTTYYLVHPMQVERIMRLFDIEKNQ